MNLLHETIAELKAHNKTPEDVLWVGDLQYWFPWQVFEVYADFNYDDGYGSQVIAEDLIVVGDGWWLARGEYDGSEWWNYLEPPIKPETMMIPVNLKAGTYNSIWRKDDE